ncbi:hypothetical protein EJ110_NYTH16162 [Nymphaea thermarum]|nr:hypothetical protein EJ110_NYTH16162 [Nymphaea thermarum]
MDQPNSSILSSSFLSQKLNHSNYLTWKRQIVPFIKSHRLYGHIDDTTPAPPQYIDREVKRTVVADQGGGASTESEIRFEYETVTENNPAYEVWLAHDQSLVAYITSTLSEEVLGGVDDDLTALELWSTPMLSVSRGRERFSPFASKFAGKEALFLVVGSLGTVGSLEKEGFLVSNTKKLRRQFQDIKRGTRTVLEYLNEIKSVSDQLAAIGHPVSDKDKVQQALSELGTEFDIFCTALEVLPILPSFEDLKAKLFQHEASRVQRQNLISSNSHNVLITGTHAMQGHSTRPWTPHAGMGRGILPTPPGTNTTSSTPRRVPTCFYCNKRGHVKSECWHNPQNKNNHIRREGKAAAGAASSSSGQNVTSNIPADAQQLLMTAISKLQLKQNEQGEWYVDSGAAAHVTGDTAGETRSSEDSYIKFTGFGFEIQFRNRKENPVADELSHACVQLDFNSWFCRGDCNCSLFSKANYLLEDVLLHEQEFYAYMAAKDMIFEQHSSHLGKLSPAKQGLAQQLDWALHLSLEKQEMMYHQGRQAV